MSPWAGDSREQVNTWHLSKRTGEAAGPDPVHCSPLLSVLGRVGGRGGGAGLVKTGTVPVGHQEL